MNRAIVGVAVVALVLGALLGYLGSGLWPGSKQAQLKDAQEKSARLEREVNGLRAENDRMAADLKGEQARGQTMAADLHREKGTNMRLNALVSAGKK